jgi:hypothetical protein
MQDQQRGFCLVQQVNSTPPLSTHNWYACLQVDTLIEPAVCKIESVKVLQTTSHPPNQTWCSRLPPWEHQLPNKYVVAARYHWPLTLKSSQQTWQSGNAHKPLSTVVQLGASLILNGHDWMTSPHALWPIQSPSMMSMVQQTKQA